MKPYIVPIYDYKYLQIRTIAIIKIVFIFNLPVSVNFPFKENESLDSPRKTT